MTISTSELHALSPLDGRYRAKIAPIAQHFSEKALIAARLRVEAAWLLFLDRHLATDEGPRLEKEAKAFLESLTQTVESEAAVRVKEIESTTNHDVKACEYYLREELTARGASEQTLAFIHFACTSEDINNLAYALMMKECREQVLMPKLSEICRHLEEFAKRYASIPMLSRTHGQTASPTTLGKEWAVFHYRLKKALDGFDKVVLLGKINGAVGNYNAHQVAFPELDWRSLTKDFIESLGLRQNPLTTQIENHDAMVEFTDRLVTFNTIALGMARDIWAYIAIGYFHQKSLAHEVGSSTMPHKVNPIDFENSEGNLGVANALGRHFAEKLPISRWQRDLSDSTVQRVLGTFLGHSFLAYQSLLVGLSKIEPNRSRIEEDLLAASEVLGEAIQTVMRRYGVKDAYERLKEKTRGQKVTQEILSQLIDDCQEIPNPEKERLKSLTPEHYIGYATQLAEGGA